MMDVAFQIAELKRRIDDMVRVGTIVECRYESEPPMAKVRFGETLSGWIPFMADRANGQEVSWDAPEVGERVLVLALSGDTHSARILPGALYCEDHPQPSVSPDIISRQHNDGSHDTYDRSIKKRKIQLHDDGIFEIQVGASVLTITKNGASLAADEITMTALTDINLHGPTITLHGDVNLGGVGGKPVARKGDVISTDLKKIMEGSSNVKSK